MGSEREGGFKNDFWVFGFGDGGCVVINWEREKIAEGVGLGRKKWSLIWV